MSEGAQARDGLTIAFAGYPNLVTPSSFFSNNHKSLHLHDARWSLFMRIRPFYPESSPLPPGSPTEPRRR